MTALVLDHLWQSTLVALGIGLLALAFRKAAASVRHALWLSASVKFLVPFAALAALGRLMGPAVRLPAPAAPQAILLKQAAAPFSQSFFVQPAPVSSVPPAVAPASFLADFPLARAPDASAPLIPAHAAAASAVHAAPHPDLGLILQVVPWLIVALWALGSAAIAIDWIRRWARLRAVMRAARPLAWPAPMPVLAAPSLLEPGLLGLWRPVLLLPESLPGHLSQVETAAVIAHEACHLRRRDNLTAALHMVVEVLFWFHPLVWWIGARLIAERERACDEAVVAAGHDRAVYARSLVESCRLYLQSPLDCVAGASGSNLKTRVEAIMTAPPASPLSPLKRALLLAAGVCAFATPVAAGLLTPEAQKAVAPLARAVAAIAAPAKALADPDQDAAPKPVALARNDAILAPRLAESVPGDAPIALTRDIAAPAVQAPSAARSVEVAAATPPAPVAQASTRPDPIERASAFVQSYAAVTPKHDAIARWVQPICVNIVALADRAETPEEIAAKQRIEDVAKAVGVQVHSGEFATSRLDGGSARQVSGCLSNIQIGFTDDPQVMLDRVIKQKGRLLGDASSGTRSARTVTLPIQAWYETNGKDVAANETGELKAKADYRGEGWAGLKTPVLYQGSYPFPGGPTPSSNVGIDQGSYSGGSFGYGGGSYPTPGAFPSSPARALWAKRQFINIFIIVDLKRTMGADPRALADYVAMLTLSQPKSLGSCQALPSITDLFASCSGRAAPAGLTAADMAYLHALYAGDEKSREDHSAVVANVVDGMAGRLPNTGASASAEPAAAQAPDKPIHPAAFRSPAPNASSPMLQQTSYETPDLSRQARDFVQANARVGQFGYTVRWQEPLCLQVFGLTPEQNGAVKSRIQAVGQTLAQKVYSPRGTSCPQKNVTILFSTNPQHQLDEMIGHDAWFLGDNRSDTRGIKTVTRPVQAWRVTVCTLTVCRPDPFPQQPIEATVLVDARGINGAKLGAIADYVAMLVLADPRNLDQCQALPSILDLFAGPCPGRSAPAGLTRGDLAFLKALYTAGSPITQRDWNWSQHGGSVDHISGRMGMLLAGSGSLIIPGAKPVLR